MADLLRKVISQRPAGATQTRLFLNRYDEPLSRFGIWNIIAKYKTLATASMPSLQQKRITPHSLRHTTAMHLLQSGVDINVIRSWLGHVNLTTTHRYAEIDLAMKRKALALCDPGVTANRKTRWHSSPDILEWLESLGK